MNKTSVLCNANHYTSIHKVMLNIHIKYTFKCTVAKFYDVLTNTKDNTKKEKVISLISNVVLSLAANHSETPLGKH